MIRCPECNATLDYGPAQAPYLGGPFCWSCGVHRTPASPPTKRLVWIRTRAVSYSSEVEVARLMKNGRILGEDAWWEPWPG